RRPGSSPRPSARERSGTSKRCSKASASALPRENERMRPVLDPLKEKKMTRSCLILAALLAAAPGARAAAVSKVTAVEVAPQGGKLIIHADVRPEFTVFKLSAPPRVVIDLNGGDVSAAARPLAVHKG